MHQCARAQISYSAVTELRICVHSEYNGCQLHCTQTVVQYLVSAPFSSSSSELKAPMRGEALSRLGKAVYCSRMLVDLCSMEAAWRKQQGFASCWKFHLCWQLLIGLTGPPKHCQMEFWDRTYITNAAICSACDYHVMTPMVCMLLYLWTNNHCTETCRALLLSGSLPKHSARLSSVTR